MFCFSYQTAASETLICLLRGHEQCLHQGSLPTTQGRMTRQGCCWSWLWERLAVHPNTPNTRYEAVPGSLHFLFFPRSAEQHRDPQVHHGQWDTYVLGHLSVLVVDGPALLGSILQRVSRFCVSGEGDRENKVTMTQKRKWMSPT